MKISKQEQKEALERLHELLKPGDTVFTVLRRVAPSGMTRWIDLYVIREDTPFWLSHLAARACGFTFDNKHESIKIGGCGMDMGFSLVYDLGRTLYPDGFLIKGHGKHGHEWPARRNTPENRQIQQKAIKSGTFEFRGRNGDTSGIDPDGGYALKRVWL